MYRAGDTIIMPVAPGSLQPSPRFGLLAKGGESANHEVRIPVYNIAHPSQHLPSRFDYFNLPHLPQFGEEANTFTAITNYNIPRELVAPFHIQKNQPILYQDDVGLFALPEASPGFWPSPVRSATNIPYNFEQARLFQSSSSSDDPGNFLGNFETIYTPGRSTGSPQTFSEFIQWPPIINKENPIFDLELPDAKDPSSGIEHDVYHSQLSESVLFGSTPWNAQGIEEDQMGGPFLVVHEQQNVVLDDTLVEDEFSRLGPYMETGEPWHSLSAQNSDTQRAQVFEKPLVHDFHGVSTNTLYGPQPPPNEHSIESWTHVFPAPCAKDHSHSPTSWHFEYMPGFPTGEQRRKGGRQGKMTAEKKKITRAVRKAAACWPCHLKKIKCSTESRCRACQKVISPRKPVLLPCFRDPIESMSPLLVPKYVFGHMMTIKEVHKVVKNEVHSWGTELIPIKLSWGLPKLIEIDVSVVYPSSLDSDITTQYQSENDENGRPKLFRSKSPLLGIPLDALNSLQSRYTNYVRDIVQNEALLAQYAREAYIGEISEVPGRLLCILCSWYNESKRNGPDSVMLREALEIHIICTIIDRSFLFDQNSYENACRRLKHKFPRHAAPSLAQRQLKFIFFQGQDRRIRSVLQSWGKSIRKIEIPSPTLWPIDFCVLAIMCLVMDMTIRSAYELHLHRMDTNRETNDRELREIVRIIETELFQKSKEIFHMRHKTRKGIRDSYNPLIDEESGGPDLQDSKLIRELRQLVSCIGKQPAQRHVPGTSNENSYKESGQLTRILLNDFL